MPSISCTGRSGILRTFNYEVTHEPLANEWIYRVTASPKIRDGGFFEMTVAEICSSRVRVVMTNHFNQTEYAGMGIAEALLPEIKVNLGRSVESSPSKGAVGDVYRTPEATKYWERLRNKNGAEYDGSTDIYTVI
jgi:hypothetical protein